MRIGSIVWLFLVRDCRSIADNILAAEIIMAARLSGEAEGINEPTETAVLSSSDLSTERTFTGLNENFRQQPWLSKTSYYDYSSIAIDSAQSLASSASQRLEESADRAVRALNVAQISLLESLKQIEAMTSAASEAIELHAAAAKEVESNYILTQEKLLQQLFVGISETYADL